jgi:hypothetical protein
VVAISAIPLFYDTELLKNPSFQRKPGDTYFGWQVVPEIGLARSAQGAEEGDLAVELLSGEGWTVLSQNTNIHPTVADIMLDVSCTIKSVAPRSVQLVVTFQVAGQAERVRSLNVGGGEWETLHLKTPIPRGADLNDVEIKVSRSHDAVGPVLVDRASAMMVEIGAAGTIGN